MAVSINMEKCMYCGACLTYCPEKAVILEDDIYRILPELCTECHVCIHKCWGSAIQAE